MPSPNNAVAPRLASREVDRVILVAPLVSWSVLPELTKILCEGYDVFCKDWVALLSLK